MRPSNYLVSVLLLTLGFQSFASFAAADTFGGGANIFNIEFVTIGNPGNPPDENPNPAGAVPYAYRIGKYEVSEQMIDKANSLSAAAGSPLNITKEKKRCQEPIVDI